MTDEEVQVSGVVVTEALSASESLESSSAHVKLRECLRGRRDAGNMTLLADGVDVPIAVVVIVATSAAAPAAAAAAAAVGDLSDASVACMRAVTAIAAEAAEASSAIGDIAR